MVELKSFDFHGKMLSDELRWHKKSKAHISQSNILASVTGASVIRNVSLVTPRAQPKISLKQQCTTQVSLAPPVISDKSGTP